MNIFAMPSLRPSLARPDRLRKRPPKPAPFRLASATETIGELAPECAPESLLASGFHELFAAAPGDESTALAFAVSMAAKAPGGMGKSLCFCRLANDVQERGELYGHGLAHLGIAPGRLLMVTAAKEKDLLWTLEEAVSSSAFGAVIGALGSHERLYAFAESRRLKLRAAAGKMPLFLLRHRQNGGATAAHGRWRVSALPSRPQADHAGCRLLGPPRLQLQLERMASVLPQRWEMEFDAARGFHLAPFLENGPTRAAGRRRRRAA